MVGKNTNFAGTVNIVTSCKPAFELQVYIIIFNQLVGNCFIDNL